MPPITFLSAAVPDSCTFNPFCEKAIALLGALQPAQKRSAVVFKPWLAIFIELQQSHCLLTLLKQFSRKKKSFQMFPLDKRRQRSDPVLLSFRRYTNTNSVAIFTSAQLIQLFICSQFGYMHLDLLYFNMDSYCLNLWANFSLFLKNLFTVI